MLYRAFATQDELDREYNPTAAIPDAASIFDRWRLAGGVAVDEHPCILDVRYGPTLAETLDVFPVPAATARPSPVHVFIHGGYWRRFSARDHAFVAPALTARGCTAVIVNYALCPTVTIDEIVRQVRAALAWTHGNIAAHGGDPERITVSGHSAGGHLTAMALATDWAGAYGLPPDIVKGALLISGLYDLNPFPFTYLQPALQFTWDQVRRNSPLFLGAGSPCPVQVLVGGLESSEFRRQSEAYAGHLAQAGYPVESAVIGDADHLSVMDGYGSAGSRLQAALDRVAAGA